MGRQTNKEASPTGGQRISDILYHVKAKSINEALVKKQAIVEKKKLCERLAKVKAKAILADRLVAIQVETLGDGLSTVKTVAAADTVAHRVLEVVVQTLCYTLAEVDAEKLIYAVADRQPVVLEEKICNTLAKEKCKAVVDTLAAKE